MTSGGNSSELPAITAVVPTHKRPELMRRAVQSILDQRYDGRVEIIVVFDACDPILPDVELTDGRTMRAQVNARTRGLAGARNTGIIAATSEFVAFLDDDDVWLPGKLERQVAEFTRRPDSILVGTASYFDDGTTQHERLVGADTVTAAQLIENKIAGLHSSGFMFRRSALLGELGLVDEELPRSYGEDYDLLLRVAALVPIAVVDVPLVNVTWKGESFFLGQWQVYAQAHQYLLEKHPVFTSSRSALSHLQARIAFALAASGQRTEGRQWATRALRNNPLQVKAVLAYAIALRLVSADRVTGVVRRFGKGI